MQALTDGVLAFLSANPGWVFAIAFAMGAIETMIVVSLFFPSTLIILGAGALVATGQIPFWPLCFGAGLGAIAGSSLAWWLGAYFHEPVLRWRPLRRRHKDVERVRRVLQRWGLWAAFAGHFVPPLRGPIFLLVGASRVRYAPFLAVTAAGGIIWGYLTPTLGAAGGHALGWLLG